MENDYIYARKSTFAKTNTYGVDITPPLEGWKAQGVDRRRVSPLPPARRKKEQKPSSRGAKWRFLNNGEKWQKMAQKKWKKPKTLI